MYHYPWISILLQIQTGNLRLRAALIRWRPTLGSPDHNPQSQSPSPGGGEIWPCTQIQGEVEVFLSCQSCPSSRPFRQDTDFQQSVWGCKQNHNFSDLKLLYTFQCAYFFISICYIYILCYYKTCTGISLVIKINGFFNIKIPKMYLHAIIEIEII